MCYFILDLWKKENPSIWEKLLSQSFSHSPHFLFLCPYVQIYTCQWIYWLFAWFSKPINPLGLTNFLEGLLDPKNDFMNGTDLFISCNNSFLPVHRFDCFFVRMRLVLINCNVSIIIFLHIKVFFSISLWQKRPRAFCSLSFSFGAMELLPLTPGTMGLLPLSLPIGA